MTKTEKVAGLSSSKPALETQLAMIELQRMLTEFNPAAQIEQSIQQLREIPRIYGELIAEQIVPVTEPLVQILQEVRDVTSELKTTVETLNQLAKAATSTPKPASNPKPAQASKTVPKDPVLQAMPWLLLMSITLNLAVLAVVFLRV